MLKQVLINVEATDMRIAMLEDGQLVELFVENSNSKSMLGNIYKGRVEGIVPGLKAVFVNVGLKKNAFLHFSDILQEYELPARGRPERFGQAKDARNAEQPSEEEESAAGEMEDDYISPQILPGEPADDLSGDEGAEPEAQRPPRRSRTLHVGDSILVQVVKEPINDKGPRVTSYLSLPGRYLVMMPFSDHKGGVSRKIEDQIERRRLRELLRSLDRQAGAGSFIIRTAGLEVEEGSINEDYQALLTQWNALKRKNIKLQAPALIHNEQEILQRIVRDVLRNDIDEILIDSKVEMKKLIETCQEMAPGMIPRIHLYESSKSIFDVFEVEQQFQKALRRKVWLKSGGAIVIDETEALTAIDVNSGKYVGSEDQQSVILKTNLEACDAVSRQLRLRDLGGLVVIDFIDMTNRDHQQQVLREFKSRLRRDNAKYSMTGFSEFGLVELTRKRVRMSLAHSVYRTCPYCEGSGKILGHAQIWKSLKYDLLDNLTTADEVESVEISVHPEVRDYLAKDVVAEIKSIAHRFNVKLNFVGKADYHQEQFSIVKTMKSGSQDKKEKQVRTRRTPAKKGLESTQVPQDNSPQS